MKISNKLLTISETALFFKLTSKYIKKLINEDKIVPIKIENQLFIDKQNIETYINKNHIFIEPCDRERTSDNIPDIVALSFFLVLWG